MPWSVLDPSLAAVLSWIGRRFVCAKGVRFPPGLMAVMACRLCPFSPELKPEMFATRELLVRHSAVTVARVSMDAQNSCLDVVIRGPPAEMAEFAPKLVAEVKSTIHLPRWGE